MATSLHLRTGDVNDLDSIVDVTLKATADLSLYHFNFPHRLQFPADQKYHWQCLIKRSFYDPKSVILVVESTDIGERTDIVGWAEWEWKSEAAVPTPPFVNSWAKSFGGEKSY